LKVIKGVKFVDGIEINRIAASMVCFTSSDDMPIHNCQTRMKPLKNVHFYSSSRKGKILTTGIH